MSDRISTHYQELLEEREALILKLSEKEQTLRTFLEEKTLAELELKKEKQELITVGTLHVIHVHVHVHVHVLHVHVHMIINILCTCTYMITGVLAA